jgi:hypothetical protein
MGKVARNQWAAALRKERARDRRTTRKTHTEYIPNKRRTPAQLHEAEKVIKKLTAANNSDPFFYSRAWSRFNAGLVQIDDLNAGSLD